MNNQVTELAFRHYENYHGAYSVTPMLLETVAKVTSLRMSVKHDETSNDVGSVYQVRLPSWLLLLLTMLTKSSYATYIHSGTCSLTEFSNYHMRTSELLFCILIYRSYGFQSLISVRSISRNCVPSPSVTISSIIPTRSTSLYVEQGGGYPLPGMPWEDEKNIKNRISEERYAIWDDFRQQYRSRWRLHDGPYQPEGQVYEDEWTSRFKAFQDCEEEDRKALQALLRSTEGL